MTHDIATLLTRNLHDVFGEDDPVRRRATIEKIFTPDAIFHEPGGTRQGWGEIDQIAGEIRAAHPDFRYTPLRAPEVLHDVAGRIQWVSGRPGEAPAYAGTDFVQIRDGRIAAVYLFFDPLP